MNTWTVDPNEAWLEQNQQWLLEANLPDTPRCEFTLTEIRCELKAGHMNECSHMVHLNVFADLPDVPAPEG